MDRVWSFFKPVRLPAGNNELAARLRLSVELSVAPGIILFDGRCRFCRWIVRLLLAAESELQVCSVHTTDGRTLAEAFGRAPEETFAFLTAGSAYFDVDAYVTILAGSRYTRWLARLIASTPTVITGAVYRRVTSPVGAVGIAAATLRVNDRCRPVHFWWGGTLMPEALPRAAS